MPGITEIGFRRGIYLRGYMLECIRLFARHLAPEAVTMVTASYAPQIDEVFGELKLPIQL